MRSIFSALACCFVAALPADAAHAEPSDAIRRIDERLIAASADGSGYAIIIERDGAVVLRKGYGLADREKNLPFTTGTIAQIGSITKQFTATAALTLIQRGDLSLDLPVKSYLPAAPEPLASVTLHQLMTHTAGLPEYCGDDFDRMSLTIMLDECLSKPLIFEPGTKYSYSNPGFSVVAAIVEAVSDRKFEDFLKDQIFKPNGLKHTSYIYPHSKKDVFAHGYLNGEDQGVISDRISALGEDWWNLKGNGGIQASTEDMYRWRLALLGKGKLNPAILAIINAPHTEWNDGVADGYGWFFRDEGSGEPRQMSHSGSDGVFFSVYWDRPKDGVFMYFVGNGGEEPTKAALLDVLNILRESFVPPPEQ